MSSYQDSFSIDGFWWFPENSNHKVSGTLHHSIDKITLNLMGTLTDLTKFQDQFEYEIIMGISTKGDPITLHKCYANNFSMSHPSFATSSYSILYIFQGSHFLKKEDMKFSKVYAHLTHFDEWIGLSGFNAGLDKINENKISITYSQPKKIEFDLINNFTATIWFGYSLHSSSVNEKEQGIKQRIALNIESRNEKSFFEFQKILMDIRNFLGLACLSPIHPIEVKGITESNKEEVNNQTIHTTISIYNTQSNMPKEIVNVNSANMLFTYVDIKENVQSYFQKWFENKSILEPTYNAYSGVLYNKHIYLDQKLLLLIQAVESYHRRTSNATEVTEDEHKKRLNEIMSNVPEHHKIWLQNKLQFSNEISLRKRLKSILEQFKFILPNHEQQIKPFINYVVDTRNYLTHYSNNAKENIKDYDKMYLTSEYLKLIIESCLLVSLGFPVEKIESLITKSKTVKGISNLKFS